MPGTFFSGSSLVYYAQQNRQKTLKTSRFFFIAAATLGTALVFLFLGHATPAKAAVTADLNADGCVNQSDLTLFSGYFSSSPRNQNGDISGDSAVDVKDLAFIMQGWQPSCVPVSAARFKTIWQGYLKSSFDDTKLAFLANHYDIIVIHFDKNNAGQDPLYVTARLARLKTFVQSAGRNGKVLAYYKFAGIHSPASDPVNNQYPYFYQSFIDQGLQWKDTVGSTYQAGNYWFFTDFMNALHVEAYKNLTLAYLRDLKTNYGLDGFFFDNAHIMTVDDTFTCKVLNPDGTTNLNSVDPDPLCTSATLPTPTSVRDSRLPYNNDNATVWQAKYDILKAIREDSVLSGTTLIANNFVNKADFAGTVPGHTRLEFYTDDTNGNVLANGILREEPFWQFSKYVSGVKDVQGECSAKVDATLDAYMTVPSTKSPVLYNYTSNRIGRIYSLAGGLIVNNGNTYYAVDELGAETYSPEYNIDADLGAPTGPATHPGGDPDLYVRDYTKGKVVMYTKAADCGSSTTKTYTFDSTGYQYIDDFAGNRSWTSMQGTITWVSAGSGTQTFTLGLPSQNASYKPAFIFRKP